MEVSEVAPKLIVAMGATAVQATTGNGRDILARQGAIENGRSGRPVSITSHPSYLLRLHDPQIKAEAIALFKRDLLVAVSALR